MSTDSARIFLASLAALTAFFWAAGASAECRETDEGVICPDQRWRVLVEHSRAYELLCSEGLAEGAPARIKALCEDAEDVHRIWVQAEKATEAQKAARKAQREANLCKGSLHECRAARKAAERQRDKAKRQKRVWRTLAYIAGGVALTSTSAILLDRAKLIDLSPR